MNDDKKLIQDNPTIKKMEEEIKSFSALFNICNGLGLEFGEKAKEIEELKNTFIKLSTLPDKFNTAFSKKG